MSWKSVLTVVALVNGMIGGLTLVLPIYAKQSGTIETLLILLVTGSFSFYSCYLSLIHLGNHQDLDKAIYHHFGESLAVKIFYDLLVFLNLGFILLLYFTLIVQQWEGLTAPSIINPICNAIFLLALVFFLNYFHFGAKLMGYGIISIIGYCIFLIWLLGSAPKGDGKIEKFGSGGINLASAMSEGFAIQIFFIPILRELPSAKNYIKFTLMAYVIGGLVYSYIAYGGAYGIVNRTVVTKPLQTIEDYFHSDQWEVSIIEVIYLVHLYSAFGEFLLVCKKRLFSVFYTVGLRESKHGSLLNIPEIVFAVIAIGISLGICLMGVQIDILIQINGAVIAYFFMYLLPAVMHIRCRYFTKRNVIVHVTQRLTLDFSDGIELGKNEEKVSNGGFDNLEGKNERKEPILGKKEEVVAHEETLELDDVNEEEKDEKKVIIKIECDEKKPSKISMQVLDILLVFGMMGMGTFIMIDGLMSIINQLAGK